MEQTFSDMSVQMAVERAGASELVMMVAKDVHDVLRPNEFVLEFADTTSPGFHSALAVTNYRILIGVGPGQLQEIAVDSVTRVDAVRAPEVTLLVRVYNADVTVYGLGDRGTFVAFSTRLLDFCRRMLLGLLMRTLKIPLLICITNGLTFNVSSTKTRMFLMRKEISASPGWWPISAGGKRSRDDEKRLHTWIIHPTAGETEWDPGINCRRMIRHRNPFMDLTHCQTRRSAAQKRLDAILIQ